MLLLLLASILPTERVVTDSVDGVEVNSFYGQDGNLVFDQIIFYEWNRDFCRFDVVDWRLLKGVRCELTDEQKQRRNDWPPPIPEWSGGHASPILLRGRYVSEWFDEKAKCNRRVESLWYRRSHTCYDPEVECRSVLDQDRRRGLKPK